MVILERETFEPVARSRVTELLGRVTQRRIGLVVAPAGYGKSVAVSQYLSQANVPGAWFVVREEHAKLLSFAWGLARTLAGANGNLERGLLGAYQSAGAEHDPPVALAAWFAAQLDDRPRTIVIDDLHLALEEPSARTFIVALIERAPANVRWILLSRSALDLPLATWLLYGHCAEPANEDDLRLRSTEAAAVARSCGVALTPDQIEALLLLTGGWPAAFIFALRAAGRGAEVGRIARETRANLYAYLADQAFVALSAGEQDFLLGTALLPVVDLDVLAAAGWEAPGATYAQLRRHAGFIVPESATTFAYHDLFRDFLQHRLRLKGAAAYRRAQLASAELLEGADRPEVALPLRVAAQDRAGVVRILRDQASRPALNGMAGTIEESLLSLPEDLLRGDSVLLGLLARTRVLRNAWEDTDSLYRAAIALAETADRRADLTLSYARTLCLRSGHEAALAAIRDVEPSEITNLATRARVLSLRAVYGAMGGDLDEAQRLAAETLASTLFEGPDLRALMLYHASLVSNYSNRLPEARTRATEALRIAERSGNSLLVTRCSHYLCIAAINDGDWDDSAYFAAEMLAAAKREGDLSGVSHALQTALLLATMRGDAAAIAEAEAGLGRGSEAFPDFESTRSFARAIRCAWSGDFAAARREAEGGFVAPPGKQQLEQMQARPHLAVYRAAAGDREAALETLARATASLDEFEAAGTAGCYATFISAGRIMLAVSEALLLRSRGANERLLALEQNDPKAIPAITALAQAARTLNRVAQGAEERETLERDLAAVRERGLGGYAELLAALPVGLARGTAAFGTLTKAELQMLRLIARGGTMKVIGAQLNRSPDTVETHIRAILRKLGCKTRSEAVALARDHGII